MCGISAIIDFARSAKSVETLLRMHAPIRHRGPDDERFLIVDDAWQPQVIQSAAAVPKVPIIAALAFRRLRVVDLSDAASQPMPSADRRTWICFNGEIYNFKEIRDRLTADGRCFCTHSDTEVALAAYETWGTKCFEELDGMWAIVILDLARRKLVVSRDRFGIKPLHWASDGMRLMFASEVRQIAGARAERPSPHDPLIATFLRGNRVPALDETFVRDVRPFPASSYAEILLDGPAATPNPRAFWDLGSVEPRPMAAREYARTVDEFESVLREAVRTHNVADVNVGYLLSGGLDSSTLAVLMADDARNAGLPAAPAFSFGFRDRAPEFCELRYADAVARKHNLVLRETTIDSAWIRENAGRVMRAVEEPVLGMPALAQFRIFEFCREHGMTVLIDGEASDEVLGGYPAYQFNLLRDHLRNARWLRFARDLQAISRRQEQSALGLLSGAVIQRLRRPKSYEWIEQAYGRRDGSGSRALVTALHDHGRQTSRVGRLLFRDVKWGNVKIVLGYTDRVSMAHSIEARVPYLDLKLVTMAFSLPDEFKVGNGERKRILRDVARRYLPPEVTERKDRMGFGIPVARFLNEIWPDVEARILGIANAAPFRRGTVERFVAGYRAGAHSDSGAIWRLYALARWAEEFAIAL